MPYSFVGVDHVQLAGPIGCEEEARHFYRDVLGWMEIPKPESLRKYGGVWFQCGNHQVHIGIQEDFVPAKKAHPAFQVSNLAVLKEHLLRQLIQPIDDNDRAGEGIARCYLSDPFGNRLEFIEYL
jgi:catechol 2,3-dioxygenase-like lactoylglutathione lyase family enzyme